MKNKIIIGLCVLIIVIGIIIAVTAGFNLSSNYGSSVNLFADFHENFEIGDIEAIAKEVFGDKKFELDYSDEFKQGILIRLNEATDEEINNFENKLIEKYEKFHEEDDVVSVLNLPSVRIIDLVDEYIKPVIITTVLVLIILMIIFRKAGFVKALLIPFFMIVGICGVYVSIIAILRVPVNEYVIAGGTFVYAMSLISTALYTKSKCKE